MPARGPVEVFPVRTLLTRGGAATAWGSLHTFGPLYGHTSVFLIRQVPGIAAPNSNLSFFNNPQLLHKRLCCQKPDSQNGQMHQRSNCLNLRSQDDDAEIVFWNVRPNVCEAEVQCEQGALFPETGRGNVPVWVSAQLLFRHAAGVVSVLLKQIDHFRRQILVDFELHDRDSGIATMRSRAISDAYRSADLMSSFSSAG